MEEETGIEPNRTEIFIASRTRADGSFVCDEARISVDKLKQVMNQNRSEPASEKDAFEKNFGPEHSGRGPTPSKYFSNLECSSSNDITALQSRMNGFEEKLSVITDLQSCMNGFGQKLEIVTDALFALVKQGNVKAENTKHNTSVNSDQESYISKT